MMYCVALLVILGILQCLGSPYNVYDMELPENLYRVTDYDNDYIDDDDNDDIHDDNLDTEQPELYSIKLKKIGDDSNEYCIDFPKYIRQNRMYRLFEYCKDSDSGWRWIDDHGEPHSISSENAANGRLGPENRKDRALYYKDVDVEEKREEINKYFGNSTLTGFKNPKQNMGGQYRGFRWHPNSAQASQVYLQRLIPKKHYGAFQGEYLRGWNNLLDEEQWNAGDANTMHESGHIYKYNDLPIEISLTNFEEDETETNLYEDPRFRFSECRGYGCK